MKYKGSCHCGEVKYEVDMELQKAMACNCSICSRKGHLLNFVPAESFKLISGSDFLTDYQFGKKNLHHTFCKKCGIGCFSYGAGPDGSKMYAVNIRTIEDIDPLTVPVTFYDGKSLAI